MKTFLVQYDLRISQYMDEGGPKTEARTILVEAEDEGLAKQTLQRYWDDKSEDYSVNYYAMNIEVMPTIRQLDIFK